uniref:LRAT domain-containing protein n=1 Tax=Panagrellus redivivus TaxID=6233 RepID=A0A7E4VKT1_PANRE
MGQNHSNFQDFEKYVNAVLMQNGIFDKSYRKYGITPLNQRFVLIAHTDAVRLIMETEYKDASNFISLHMGLTYMFTNIYDTKPPEGEDRLTDDNIDDVVNKRHADLEAGGNKYYGYPERIIATPKDCVQNPDATLKRGDHIRRHCNHIFFHDGIYLGNGRVAHISAPHTSTNFKRDAGARIDTLEKFAKGNPIAIVEQYIRHRHRLDIANDAERDAKSGLWQGEYDVAMRNCQHFAYKCAINVNKMCCFDRTNAELLGFFKKLNNLISG